MSLFIFIYLFIYRQPCGLHLPSYRTVTAPFWLKLQLKRFFNIFLSLFCNPAGGLTVTVGVLNVRLQLYSCWMWLHFQVGSGPLSTWTFTSRHQVGGELWRQVEPVPVPLLAPKHGESSVKLGDIRFFHNTICFFHLRR